MPSGAMLVPCCAVSTYPSSVCLLMEIRIACRLPPIFSPSSLVPPRVFRNMNSINFLELPEFAWLFISGPVRHYVNLGLNPLTAFLRQPDWSANLHISTRCLLLSNSRRAPSFPVCNFYRAANVNQSPLTFGFAFLKISRPKLRDESG